jgi:hypothetical protein
VCDFTAVLTLGVAALNVCNQDDWFGSSPDPTDGRNANASPARRVLQDSQAVQDWFAAGDVYAFMEWPFEYCHDNRVPLAGQELLALCVLAHWLKLGRIASQSQALGPLFQCVITMLSDMAKWTVLMLWLLVAFASCFTVLFHERKRLANAART